MDLDAVTLVCVALISALVATVDATGAGGVTALGVQQPHKLESHRQQKLGSAEL